MKNYIVILFILMMLPMVASAYTLDSSGANPNAIYRCQPSTITANFSGGGTITAVSLVLVNTAENLHAIPYKNGILNYSNEEIPMSYNAGTGIATYTYGNDANTMNGYKSISFKVTDGVTTTVSTGAHLMVYSDTCVGTNAQGYQNITAGTYVGGKYTKQLFTTNQSAPLALLGWIFTPLSEPAHLGSFFWFAIIVIITILIYMNSNNVIQPLISFTVMMGLIVGSSIIPPSYNKYIYLAIVFAIAGIFYKVIKKY